MSDKILTEVLLLDDAAAIELAAPFGRFDDGGSFDAKKVPEDDPFSEEIAPSLLNAGDIKKYVIKTGIISPFYEGGGRNSRMKDASYEGRIGDKAYIYDSGETEPKLVFEKGDRVLVVPANSIVFVECDLYFRVPEFIALRFNLQIKHVHRGLLLGTGPLIDPGYWGKLCIPLHNLTDEDYHIPADEGLIWIEFTKTTVITERIGRPPLGKEFKDIKAFLDKAASRFDRPSKKIGIRSSIPRAVEQSAEAARKAQATLQTIGVLGAITAFVSITAILISAWTMHNTYVSDVQGGFAELRPVLFDLEKRFASYLMFGGETFPVETRTAMARMSETIKELQGGIHDLSIQMNEERVEHNRNLVEMREAREHAERRLDDLHTAFRTYCASHSAEEMPTVCVGILTEP